MVNVTDKTRELILEIWDDDYYIVAAGDQAPTKDEVIILGEKYGIKLPDDYISHAMGSLGGFFIEVKEELWPYAEVLAVAPFWEFLRGVYSYAYSEDAPEWMNIHIAAEQFKELGHNVIPVLKVWADANVYCYNEEGRLVKYLHEENTFERVDKTWFQLIEHELNELAERKNRKLNK
ncbi:hypothetical protein LEO76_18865 [Aeromonas hydrophila]|uniref:hypothetical protein n=1 Tax=Aeromonas hydrophila TaxID=644 RepID=UPI001D0ABB40|nr:hypothetical protein [Aeromonas hydrophila]MCC0183545.1 hypothetical protein [Aeromonas hydrophila]